MTQNTNTALTTISLLLILLYGRGVNAIECFSCQGIHCQRTSKINDTITCTDQWDNCVTIFSGFTVKEKSCYSNVHEMQRKKCDDPLSHECLKCFGDRCNDKSIAKCLQCTSKDQSDCITNPDALTPVHCPISTSANTYCFTRSDKWRNLQRGCLSDVNDQIECLKNPKCGICVPSAESACNNNVESNSSVELRVEINKWWILIVFVAVQFLNY